MSILDDPYWIEYLRLRANVIASHPTQGRTFLHEQPLDPAAVAKWKAACKAYDDFWYANVDPIVEPLVVEVPPEPVPAPLAIVPPREMHYVVCMECPTKIPVRRNADGRIALKQPTVCSNRCKKLRYNRKKYPGRRPLTPKKITPGPPCAACGSEVGDGWGGGNQTGEKICARCRELKVTA